MISNTERAITVLFRMAIIEKSRANLLSWYVSFQNQKLYYGTNLINRTAKAHYEQVSLVGGSLIKKSTYH